MVSIVPLNVNPYKEYSAASISIPHNAPGRPEFAHCNIDAFQEGKPSQEGEAAPMKPYR